ncbi:MAG: acetyl-CoA carboxylase biotin carboxyl carrier protein [Oscillospiraceae bacterium]|nr:acetyl-CoA carboxylase biotin carboxyl carrier protein [Oscillospiraceae bacterium]
MADNRICSLTFDEIKELAELVSEKKLGKIEIKNGESSIVIEDRKLPPVAPIPPVMPAAPSAVMAAPAAAPAPAAQSQDAGKAAPVEEAVTGNVVKAPIVGTFYASPSPDKPAFVKVGDHIKKGDVIFIVESMKLMNEIQSEFEGTVEKILVDNASAVEYDQPIMIIK